MKGFRKRTAHGLKAVGGSFMDADLKVHIKNRKLEQTEIMSRIFFQKCMLREGERFFSERFVLRYENSVSRKKVYGGSLL